MRKRLALCALALLVAVTLTGCGGEEPPKSDPAPSAEPSPTVPPGLDATQPTRPADQAETSDSAREYGTYFAQLVQYGIETRNSRVINAEVFDQASCSSCVTVATLIDELKRTGFWQLSDPIELGRFTVGPFQGGFRVRGSFIYPEAQNVKVSGEVGRTTPAQDYRYIAGLTWEDKKETWQVTDFIYLPKS